MKEKKKHKDGETFFVLSPGYIVYQTLQDFGVYPGWDREKFEAIYESIMESLARSGYVEKRKKR